MKNIQIDREKAKEMFIKAAIVKEYVNTGNVDKLKNHGIVLSTPVQNPNRKPR